MDAVLEVLSKSPAERSEEDIGECVADGSVDSEIAYQLEMHIS